jgi:hypothetical protein
MSKAQILDELQEENASWEAFLEEIGEERMLEAGVAGDWTIKDIVAHLTGWRQRSVQRLEASLRGEPAPPTPWPGHMSTDEEINGWIYESSRDRSVQDVLQDSRDTFRHLFEAIGAFPEPELMDASRFDWLEGKPLSGAMLFGHFHEEHEPDMRAWLAKLP